MCRYVGGREEFLDFFFEFLFSAGTHLKLPDMLTKMVSWGEAKDMVGCALIAVSSLKFLSTSLAGMRVPLRVKKMSRLV